MRFSARLAASQRQPLIYDDAPKATRVGYIKRILCNFVGQTQSIRQQRKEPLEIYDTHAAFIALIREESEPWQFDESSAWAALSEHLKQCGWAEFFDFVEMVGALLIKADDEIPWGDDNNFKTYQSQVNALFLEDRIGWALNDQGQLRRQQPKALASTISNVDQSLAERFAAARVHYKKAHQYLYQHPIDEANSVKEIVSAVESVAKSIDPQAATLGDAIKRLRKDARYAPLLLDAMEKIYAYSNATPLVRHGHARHAGPSLAEAEVAFTAGVGFIRYLIDAMGPEDTV